MGHTKNYIYVGIKDKNKNIKNEIVKTTIYENSKEMIIGNI